ncbi:hypothetical protein ACN9M1_20605 [Ralstonia sp. R-29]|uniref:hypothetical protein n=1 Tax=Ralstonia sp. R-29 TaxID=3404059 RepID=UPI003CF5E84A
MLSAHEFATLMLVSQSPEQVDMNRAELETLLERQLVMLERAAEGHRRRAQLTDTGRLLLQALHPEDRHDRPATESAYREDGAFG